MRGFSTRRFTLTAIAASGALAASLALAGSAVAVAPASATASYDCGFAGSGTVTLTAADSGSKTIRVDSADIRTQFPLEANSVTTTLKLNKTSGGVTSEVQFSGSAHQAANTGDPLSFGPLPLTSGSLAAGDTTDSAARTGKPSATNWSLKFTVNGADGNFTSYCTATSNQSTALTW
ncbi:hypothetical protein [Streptomyces griseus]|uniref:hypothetical protein n=1 Tax=Streptomyces griseus TaxID=1911 RepID=UPI00055CCAC5|nr:hypothetical protein [Streptomyces griseus]